MSTRFNTVHPGRAPLPGPPRFTTVVFDMSKTTRKTPGSSRSIRHHPGPSGIIPVHHGRTTVQTPVLPDSPRSMDRGEPGSTGSPVGLGHKVRVSIQSINYFICRHNCITIGTCNTEIHRICFKQPCSKYRNNMNMRITHTHTIDVSSASGF